MKVPKHFKLKAEDQHSYEIVDTRDNKSFHVAKSALDLQTHGTLSKIQKFDEGGEVQGDENSGSLAAPVTVNVNTPTPTAAPTPTPAIAAASMPTPAPAASAIPAPFPPVVMPEEIGTSAQPTAAAQSPVSAQPPMPAVPAAIPRAPASLVGQARGAQALGERGIREQSDAEAQTSAANAAALQANNDRMQKVMDGFNAAKTNLDQENQQLTSAVMNEKIDPNAWFHDKTTAGKISTAIGLILGGIGAGLQHSNTNQALEVVKNQIANDIEAQKANLGKKQSLLSMNLQKYGNLNAATQATMAQMNAMIQGQLQLNAAKSGSLRAKGNADYAAAEWRNKYLTELPTLALQDYKTKALNDMNSQPTPPSAAGHILGTSSAAPAPRPVDNTPQVALPPTAAVDTNKFNTLRILGEPFATKEDLGAATKEMQQLQESEATKRLLKNDFDQMILALRDNPVSGQISQVKNAIAAAPWLGPIIERIPGFTDGQRQFEGARAGAVNKINSLLTKRIGGEAAKNISLDMPTYGDDLPAIQQKFNRVVDLLNSNTPTSTLESLGVVKR